MKYVLMVLISIIIFCPLVKSDELPTTPPIVVPNQIKVAWEANDASDEVTEYKVYLLYDDITVEMQKQPASATTFTFDLTGNVDFNEPKRVFIYVTAFNSAGESLPSDDVSYIYINQRRLFGDVDNSGKVDGTDALLFWRSFWRETGDPLYSPFFDAYLDGKIDGTDHVYLGNNFWEILP